MFDTTLSARLGPEASVVELAPEVVMAVRQLAALIENRRKRPGKIDPLTSACRNFVRGNPLMDDSAPLIRTILGASDGTRFGSRVPESAVAYVSNCLEKALRPLIDFADSLPTTPQQTLPVAPASEGTGESGETTRTKWNWRTLLNNFLKRLGA